MRKSDTEIPFNRRNRIIYHWRTEEQQKTKVSLSNNEPWSTIKSNSRQQMHWRPWGRVVWPRRLIAWWWRGKEMKCLSTLSWDTTPCKSMRLSTLIQSWTWRQKTCCRCQRSSVCNTTKVITTSKIKISYSNSSISNKVKLSKHQVETRTWKPFWRWRHRNASKWGWLCLSVIKICLKRFRLGREHRPK